MIKRIITTCLISLVSGIASAQNGTKPVELREVIGGRFYAYGAGAGMRSLPDGEHYSMMNREHNAILRYSFATGKLVDTLFITSNARECNFKRFDDYQITEDGKHILLYTDTEPIYRRSKKMNVYHFDVRRRLVSPLSETAGKVMIPTFSPDGRMVAFVRDNNIFIKKFEFDTEVQVTTDGKRNEIINGTTDWAYEEELETTKLMSWSEDGLYLSFVRSDERAVPEYKMPMYTEHLYPEDYKYKYPVPGENNSKVSLHIYNVTDRSQKRVAIPEGDAYYIPRIEYIGRNQDLAVMTLNRHQNHFRMIYVNSKTLIPKTIFEEKNSRYLTAEDIHSIQFTREGFAYLSERSGYTHAYLFSDRGQLIRPLTSGKYDVTQFYGLDNQGNAYYQAADLSPADRNIYRIDSRGKKTLLGQSGGTNQATFSEGFHYYIGMHSSLNSPSVTSVYKTGSDKPLRTLEDNHDLRERLKTYQFAPKELTKLKLADGTEFNGWMVKPVNFDANKKYPVLMIQYSGPDSQLVLNQYGFGWEYALAEKGFIVVCYDGRGTGARGEEWRKMTYLKLGIQESDDQIAAAKALGKLPYVDASRIGIWGWSFGGYNTLMSLTRSQNVFKLGIAVAPVTDWSFYDTIYTERFMRTPKENPEGYKQSSALEHAKDLKSRLLIMHGSADDNVHLQNTMDFTRELVDANIPFDMAIYTDKDHGIRGGNTSLHIYSKMMQYLIDHL